MAFSGIPIAAPVASPQAGINYSPMDQIGNLFTQLPLLAKLLAGNQNNQNQQNQANNQSAQAPNPESSLVGQLGAGGVAAASAGTAGALTTGQQVPKPIAPTPVSYAGTGYNPQMINQIPKVGPYGPAGAGPGGVPGGVPGSGMDAGMNPQALLTLMQMLSQGGQGGGTNPYAMANNPYAQAQGGMGSGLRNPAAGY